MIEVVCGVGIVRGMSQSVVAALYKFTPFEAPESLRDPLLARLDACGVKGTILLASEGVNGTIAGSRAGIDAALEAIRALPGCSDLEHKESFAEELPFIRLKVKLKKEIVTIGVPGVDPNAVVGTYVDPGDWNELIADPDTVVIDTRNDYEVAIGTFEHAIDPKTSTFRELPNWLDAHKEDLRDKKVAMFCTGGIRCEKASSLFKTAGIEDVFHLKGGILKYLELVPEEDSLWQGDCFVFDDRISVKHGLEQGDLEVCGACRWPIDDAGRRSPNYVRGVSCDNCIDTKDDAQRARYRERQKQMDLAEQRGELHIGATYDTPPKKRSE